MPKKKGASVPSEGSKKRKSVGTMFKDAMSVAATALLMKWAWGVLSAVDVQELALAIKLSGNEESEIADLASLGASGIDPGHVHRDLERSCCKNLMSPAPQKIRIPCKESKGHPGATLFTDVEMYFASGWLQSLACTDALEETFELLFGTSRLRVLGQTGEVQPQAPRAPIIEEARISGEGYRGCSPWRRSRIHE